MADRHYHILGIPPGAGKTEIRKAYRRKVLLLHPDRNPSPAAREEFLRVREAYDALMERGAQPVRPAPRPDAKPYPKYSRQANDPFYKARWQEYRRQQQARRAEEEIENTSLYSFLVYTARAVAIAGTALCLALLADFVLPAHTQEQTILNRNIEIVQQRSIAIENRRIHTERYQIPVQREMFFLIAEGDKITVQASPLFEIPRRMTYTGTEFKPAYGIFSNFAMFAIALFALSLAGLWSWKRKGDLLINSFFNLALLIIVLFIMNASH